MLAGTRIIGGLLSRGALLGVGGAAVLGAVAYAIRVAAGAGRLGAVSSILLTALAMGLYLLPIAVRARASYYQWAHQETT